MKVYVCEIEGYGSVSVTLSYVEAWKIIRKARVDQFNWWSNNITGQKYLTKKSMAYDNVKR